MSCRKLLAGWMGAAVVGALSLAIAPSLFGGGGDEGVDILPFGGGGAGASGSTDGGDGVVLPHRPEVGFIAAHARQGSSVVLDANGGPQATGLILSPHVRADLFLGKRGSEPGGTAATSLDILTKGKRKLRYGEMASSGAGMAARSWLNLDGRFQIEDFNDADGETVELAARERKPATLLWIIGQRAASDGAIGKSFSRIDAVITDIAAGGAVDLAAARAEAEATLAGSGLDVAVVLLATTSRGTDEAWAAFNVDDRRNVYDIEILRK